MLKLCIKVRIFVDIHTTISSDDIAPSVLPYVISAEDETKADNLTLRLVNKLTKRALVSRSRKRKKCKKQSAGIMYKIRTFLNANNHKGPRPT